jgi:hypothetical protein
VKVALVDVGRTGNPTPMCPGHYHDYLGHLGGLAGPGRVLFGEGQCRACKTDRPHPQHDLPWPQDQYQEALPKQGTRKTAHDSGDGATIFHCPFCGSGQVIARSDRTVECEYCHTCFTAQVQPQFPAFPQTIDGMPMQVPGMPGQIDGPPAAPGAPGDPMAAGGDPMDAGAPGGAPDGGGGFPPGDGGEDEEDDGEDAPPFAKGSMLHTASGGKLSAENYLRHLAIKFADQDEKDAVIERVRKGR